MQQKKLLAVKLSVTLLPLIGPHLARRDRRQTPGAFIISPDVPRGREFGARRPTVGKK